jgi:hypothetical protein
MLTNQDYAAALTPGTDPNIDPNAGDPTDTSPRYTRTKDPNVMIGRYGVKITKDDMDNANKQGMSWDNLDHFADWLGGWAHQVPDFGQVQPYYRTYPSGKIDGGDIALLMAKNDPSINKILQRNLAKDGEVPMFSADDSDTLKSVIANQKKQMTDEQYIALAKAGAKQ